LISKEALIGFTLWLLAAIGVGVGGGVTKPEAAENRQDSQTSIVRQVTQPNKPNVIPEALRPEAILQEVFTFNERSERVGQLQAYMGVTVDAHYGKLTRKAHIAALEAAGIETAFVPAVPNPITDGHKKRYNISDDPTHRCPQFEPLFQQYGLEPVEVFSYIAYRESRCNPAAVNAKFDSKGKTTWTLNKDGSIDRGLIQINSCWKTVTKNVCGTGLEGLFDVHCNLKVAKYIMDNSSGGLSNWNVWGK
jgi:hypothetical protein